MLSLSDQKKLNAESTTTSSDKCFSIDSFVYHNIANEFIMTKERFSSMVERIYINYDGEISFIDAVLQVAEFFSIDIQDTPKYISNRIVERIKTEAIKERRLKQQQSKYETNSFEESLDDFLFIDGDNE